MGFDHILLSPAFSTGLLASHPSVSEVGGEVPVPTPTEKTTQSFCQLLFHDSSISQFSQELL